MKHAVFAALLALIPAGASVANASSVRNVSLDELLSDPRLIGHTVEITTCAGIPVSDAPADQNVLLLFPCGASPSKIMDDRKAAIGRIDEATVLKPADKAPTGDSPIFEGRFRGVLRRGTSQEDMLGALVIDLDLVEIRSWVEDP